MTTFGSFCSGAEMLGAGIEAVVDPLTHLWHAEIDPAASKVLAHHYPDVRNLGDITVADWSTVPPVDVLAAGFPCQDVSGAGLRKGLGKGTRTGIWSHIAEAIGVLRPKLVLLENVEGLHSARADSNLEPCAWCVGDYPDRTVLRASGAVCGDLANLGFHADWVTVPASDVGAPHRRKRVFIAAYPVDTESLRHWIAGPESGQGVPAATVGGAVRPGELNGSPALLPTPNAALGRQAGNPSPRVAAARRAHPERTFGLDDAVALLPSATVGVGPALLPTPTVADARGTRNATAGRSTVKPTTNNDGWTLSDIAFAERWGEYAPAIARWEQVIGRPAPEPTETGTKGQPRLSPRFVEWMMGLPDGWVCAVPGLSRNDMLRILGNGVVWQQAAYAYRWLLSLDYA